MIAVSCKSIGEQTVCKDSAIYRLIDSNGTIETYLYISTRKIESKRYKPSTNLLEIKAISKDDEEIVQITPTECTLLFAKDSILLTYFSVFSIDKKSSPLQNFTLDGKILSIYKSELLTDNDVYLIPDVKQISSQISFSLHAIRLYNKISKLTFASGRDFEVQLLDKKKGPLWNSSEGMMFTMAVKEFLPLKVGEIEKYSIDIDQSVFGDLNEGIYLLNMTLPSNPQKFNYLTDFYLRK